MNSSDILIVFKTRRRYATLFLFCESCYPNVILLPFFNPLARFPKDLLALGNVVYTTIRFDMSDLA